MWTFDSTMNNVFDKKKYLHDSLSRGFLLYFTISFTMDLCTYTLYVWNKIPLFLIPHISFIDYYDPLPGLRFCTDAGDEIAIITTAPPPFTEITQIIKVMMSHAKPVPA